MESFFGIFTYNHIDMEGADRCINLEDVTITRDIPSLGLKKGQHFHTCWWYVDVGMFHFINWERKPDYSGTVQPNKTSFEINQFRLAPYMVWRDKDLPKL